MSWQETLFGFMDRALSWPVVVIVIVVSQRAAIGRALDRIKSVKGLGAEAEFHEMQTKINQATREITVIDSIPSRSNGNSTSSDGINRRELTGGEKDSWVTRRGDAYLRRVSEKSPTSTFVSGWAYLDLILNDIAFKSGLEKEVLNGERLIEDALKKSGIIPGELAEVVSQMRGMQERVLNGMEPTASEAVEYIEITNRAAKLAMASYENSLLKESEDAK